MTDDPRCPAHPSAPAVAACAQCGRWVCADCRRVGDDGLGRCVECAESSVIPEVAAPTEAPDAPTPAPLAEMSPAGDDIGAPVEEPARPEPVEPEAPEAADPRPIRPEVELEEPAWVEADRARRARRAEAAAAAAGGAGGAGRRVQVVIAEPIAWEQRGGFSDLSAFAATARDALRGPTRFMARIPWVRRDLRTPLIFAVLAGVLGHIGLMLTTALTGAPAGMGGTAGLSTLPLSGSLTLAPMLPLMVTVSIFVGSWLAHAMLRLAGNPPRPFEATFRIYAYAEVSSLLLPLPWIGMYAAQFVFIFLLLTGFRMAQGAGFSASLLAMAPSVVLTWLI